MGESFGEHKRYDLFAPLAGGYTAAVEEIDK